MMLSCNATLFEEKPGLRRLRGITAFREVGIDCGFAGEIRNRAAMSTDAGSNRR